MVRQLMRWVAAGRFPQGFATKRVMEGDGVDGVGGVEANHDLPLRHTAPVRTPAEGSNPRCTPACSAHSSQGPPQLHTSLRSPALS
eukprot:365140-Chlamydomonas_euryale.AAC.4